jgi:hypothetical protein
MHLPDQRFWPLLGWGLVSVAFPKLLARSLRFHKPTPGDSEASLERVARTWRITGLIALGAFVGLAFVRY